MKMLCIDNRTIKTLVALLLMSTMVGCNSDSKESTTPASTSMGIHFYQPDWTYSELVYRTNAAETQYKYIPMEKNNEGWWSVTIEDANKIEFAFKGDTGTINLGATQGCYAGDHYACDSENDPAENFRNSSEQIWVKNGLLYTSNPLQTGETSKSITVLSLNLHTYQEFKTSGVRESELTDDQVKARVAKHEKLFDNVAEAINELQPDLVCLQEVGEWHGKDRNNLNDLKFGTNDSNMVTQILSRVKDKNYDYIMDWSHFGWDVWMEGSAILSKHPMSKKESRYISNTDNGTKTFWKSRNVPKAQIDFGKLGKINVFSIHAGWWNDKEEPFQEQFKRLSNWAEEVKEPNVNTLFCGDFNQVAGTKEQQYITNGTGYTDLYVQANPDGLLDPTIGGTIDGWVGNVGKRIDLFVMNDNSSIEIKQSQRIFTQKSFGRVSDHTGIYAQLEITDRKLESTKGTAPNQLYLTGSHTGNKAYRGNRFISLGGSKYQLTTFLGAAEENPALDFKAHRLYLTDNTGMVQSLGSTEKGKRLELSKPFLLTEGSKEGILFESDEAGLFQFDLDYDTKTITVTQLQ